MKKIIISLTLAAFVAAPMESIAQNTQNQSKSLFDVMMRHQQENKDKKTSDKKTIAKGKTTVKNRGYWEKDIQRKSGLALFGEKIN